MVSGNQQGVFGSGDRDVEQSPFFIGATLLQLGAMGGKGVGELLAVSHRREVEDGDSGRAGASSVTAQQRRQFGGVGQPASVRGSGGKNAARQMGHRNELPLESFRGMNGEELDMTSRGWGLRGGQTFFNHVGGIEIGQQPGYRRPRRGCSCPFGVVGNDVGECIEMFGATPPLTAARGGADLEVDTDHPAGLGDQVGQ